MIQDACGCCTGMTQRDGTGREEGGGFRMGNTCTLVAGSCWYMILCMFQCHSPKSSHPLPLSQSPKVCSIYLCLFCRLYTAIFKMDTHHGPAVAQRELCSMLYGSLDARGTWERMDTCICMAESLLCSPETITVLLISYTPIQNKKVKKFKNTFFKKNGFWPEQLEECSCH